jgi:hypothetical protein
VPARVCCLLHLLEASPYAQSTILTGFKRRLCACRALRHMSLRAPFFRPWTRTNVLCPENRMAAAVLGTLTAGLYPSRLAQSPLRTNRLTEDLRRRSPSLRMRSNLGRQRWLEPCCACLDR